MSNANSAVAFAAVVSKLARNSDEAAHMRDHGPKPAQTVGKAVLAALKAGRDDTEVGCKAFLAALAPAAVPARDLAKHGNGRQQQVSKALLAAQAAASAIVWTKPALGRVTIAAGPGDVQAVAGRATKISVALRRDGDLATAASARWRFTGLGPSALSDVAVFPIGGTASVAAVTVPGRAGMADPVPFGFEILGGPSDLVGLTLGEPHAATGRLLPPVVGPTRSVVSVAQGFDAVVLSAGAPTTATVVLARAGGANALQVPVAVTGLQDGDLAGPILPGVFLTGAAQAILTLQFNPGVPGAPDRAARFDIDASGGAFDAGPTAGFDFAVREPAVDPGLPVLSVSPPQAVQVSQTQPVDVHAPASLDRSAPTGGSSVDFLAGGVPAQMFVGDTFPVGTVTVPEGLTEHPDAAVRFQLKPQANTPWRRAQVQLSLTNPQRATLAAADVGVDVIGTGGGGRGIDTGSRAWLAGTCLTPNDASLLQELDKQAAWVGSPLKLYKLKSHGTATDAALLSSLQQKGPIVAGLTQRKVATAITLDFITHQYPRGYVVQAANGALDNFWDTISRLVASWDVYGPELWIVAGHEVGSTYMHGADSDPDQQHYSNYRATMVRFRKAMRARNPKVRIDQSFIRRPQSVRIPDAFAGPDGCDGVGGDYYANPPGGIPDTAAWNKYADGTDANGPIGPRSMLRFAKSVGKPFTVAEWGPLKDEPAYVQGMHDLFSQNATDLAYEAQFCINDGGSGKDHRLSPDSTNPQASALYRRLWGSGA